MKHTIRLNMGDGLRVKDNVAITVRDIRTGRIKQQSGGHNVAMDDWKSLTAKAWGGIVADSAVHYLAWGTGTTAPDSSLHQMTAEVGRMPITQVVQGSTGVVVLRTILNGNTANGVTIGEFMLYGGATATEAVNTGTPAAWYLWGAGDGGPHAKLPTESIQLDWTLTEA